MKLRTLSIISFFIMIVIKSGKLDKYAEATQARHEARIQEVIDVTDQEVMETITAEEQDEPPQDQLYAHFQENRASFYALTGLSIDEFDKLFAHVENEFAVPSRGRKTKITPRDILILIMHFLCRYPRIEEMAAVFSIKPSTLQATFTKYIPILATILKRVFIDSVKAEELQYDGNFPDCAYAVDATVQEICRPSLSFSMAKEYFSGKHYIYCLKSQVIVTIKGLAVSIISGIPGARHDKKIFDSSQDELDALFKLHQGKSHKILADKGYQDPDSQILVTPYKGKPGDLSKEQLQYNQKLGEARIIVENFFGRLKLRYEIMSAVFRGSHEYYSDIFTICCSLVNFEQIECGHPLRNTDKQFYVKLQASLKQKKLDEKEKAKENRKRQARNRRKAYGRVGRSDDTSDDDDSD